MQNIKSVPSKPDLDIETTEAVFHEKRDRFVGEYFSSVSKIYELSRMHGAGVEKVKQDFLNDNKFYTQDELIGKVGYLLPEGRVQTKG